jgi:hypothetical protein
MERFAIRSEMEKVFVAADLADVSPQSARAYVIACLGPKRFRATETARAGQARSPALFRPVRN